MPLSKARNTERMRARRVQPSVQPNKVDTVQPKQATSNLRATQPIFTPCPKPKANG